MPENEENPFMIEPKKKEERPGSTESFGNLEEISFMATPEDLKKKRVLDVDMNMKPHWEDAGTPIWEKKSKDPNNPDIEVVDHNS